MNLKQIHELIGGEILHNNTDLLIRGVQPLELAGETDVAFILYETPKAINTNAKLIICKNKVDAFQHSQIIHPQPRLAMAQVLQHLHPNQTTNMTHSISNNCDIGQSVTLSEPVSIHAFVAIGNNTSIGKNTIISSNVTIGNHCQIGEHCIIHPNVTIYDNTVIGDHVIIHSSTVIGSDGFGYEKSGEIWEKIPHIGNVIIGNHVEIGSNTSIDRGCLTATKISDGVKIDNQIQIAHNCTINDDTIIVSGTLIGGSVTIGKRCIVAGDVSISDNVSIGNDVIIFAKSGVTKNIEDKQRISGFPAINHKEEVKKKAFFSRFYKSNN